MRSHNETFPPNPRLVFLGASNLSRAFPTIVSLALEHAQAPLDFYVAKGHGRSYGKESSCLGKKNSGIFSCGIWRALTQEKSVPITAFVTDVGNDLAYEVPVETVFGWVETCLDHLSALGARVVLSDLPMEVLRQVKASRYRLFRTILFPQCSLSWTEMLGRAEQLSERLRGLAESRKTPFFVGRTEWYGFDPIHVQKRAYVAFWSQLMSLGFCTSVELSRHRCPLAFEYYLRRLQPESWSLFSWKRDTAQPAGRLPDGSAISLY